ncbi:MAG: hypothetical protein IKY56_03960 [Alistipes sp.]|nr:hypothetical protein [Alistipes sp.]
MKKFWNLMLAALVIFGAVACTENQEENVPQAELKPVLSFVANIANDDTRVNTVEENGVWKTVWSANETLIVYGPGTEEYEFTLTDAENGVFSCYDEGVRDLIGEPVQIDNGYVNSKAGKQGAWIENKEEIVSFDPTANITLEVKSSFFRFSSASDVTLTASTEIFVEDGAISKTVTIPAGDDNWVAFLPNPNCTFSYSIDGVKCKEITKDFEAKKIYNLGFLGAPSDWEISDGTRFYTTETPDLFVAKNVKLTANNFCLHKVGDTAWGAGAKYGLVTAATKSVDTAIGLYSANWANDITISNATTTAHDIYFDRANSRLYVMTVGKHPSTVANPTHADFYNIAGSMNNWGTYTEAQKFVYSGDNVWHLVIDFKANDEFKVQKNNGWGTCYGHNNIQNNVGKSLSNGSDNAKMKAAGTYEIWVIPSHNPQLYIIKR